MRYILDIESNDLLQNGLDYSKMPYKLKPTFYTWCIVVRNIDLGTVNNLRPHELSKKALKAMLADCQELIGHNIVGFDLPVLKLQDLLEYEIGFPGQESTLYGKPVQITDTLLWSKLLNADRLGGHSLEAWGKRLGNHKTRFEDFSQFTEEMLEYCTQDTAVNESVYYELIKEQGKHDWSKAYSMEVKLAELTLRQELFGFAFNKELAMQNLAELEGIMQELAEQVNPIIPPKRLTKGKAAAYYIPTKKFKQDGKPTAFLTNFVQKIGAILSPDYQEIYFEGQDFSVHYEGPLKTHEPATIEDLDTVKGYLLSLGWEPSEVKERDLVKNADKSTKTPAQLQKGIEKYVEQTKASLFKELRLEHLDCTEAGLQQFLMKKVNGTKPIYIPTSPKLTVGVEKELCPNLVTLGEKAEFVGKVVKYYTYRHRKNSIAGGALDDDGEPSTGFLSAVREDGRIPTPADTLGANTGRYRHKIVCNVPRVTSLYGEEMRNLFGCGQGLWQLGYDFASLEARIMGHYVLPYTDGEALATALVAEKPNDIHSINAKKLGIDRSSAKSFSYAAIYGAQPKKLAKMLGISEHEGKRLFDEYWDAVPALKELKEKVEGVWERSGKKTIPGLDGRLLNTRSKHSLINVLFQSGGAISAKWSAVYLAQEMQERGILGNPFTDTTKDAKVWWLIHMHDEQQMACHPSLMKVKGFDTEEAAKTFAKENTGCSAVGHGKKGPYVGLKTAPVECIEAGIKRACQNLKLRVDLGFEYIPGLSWGQCH